VTVRRGKELTGVELAVDPPPGPNMPEGGVRTLSDWIVGHLSEPVRGGAIIQRNGLRIVVRKVRRQKVLEAQVGRDAPQ